MQRGFSSIVFILLTIVVIGIIAGVIFLVPRFSINQNSLSNNSDTQTVSQSALNPAVTKNQVPKGYPGTEQYTSKKLKIVFNYLPFTEGMNTGVKEEGNRVYVGDKNTKVEGGQYVEVFQKDPKESLNDAVKKKFLAGKSDNDCFVVPSKVKFIIYPKSFQAVEIAFLKPTGGQEPWWSPSDKCNPDYEQTNGIRYFLGDSQHPDRFLFFSIGQYAIKAGADLAWQDTIRFLD